MLKMYRSQKIQAQIKISYKERKDSHSTLLWLLYLSYLWNLQKHFNLGTSANSADKGNGDSADKGYGDSADKGYGDSAKKGYIVNIFLS